MDKIFLSKVLCIKSGTTMREALSFLNEKRIRHLPIINSNNEVIALFSKHNAVYTPELLDLPVDIFASIDIISVDDLTSLTEVCHIILQKKISCVLVKNTDLELMGIITTDDLIFHLSQILIQKSDSSFSFKADSLISAGEFFRSLSRLI